MIATESAWTGASAVGRTFKIEIAVDPTANLGSRDLTLQFDQELLSEPGAFEVVPAPEPSLVAMLASGVLGLSAAARARASATRAPDNG